MNQADGRGSGRGRQATESLPDEPAFPLRDEGRWGNRRWFSPNMPEHIDVTVLNLTCSGACCWRVAGYFVASSLLAGFPLRASRAPQLMCPERQLTLTGP